MWSCGPSRRISCSPRDGRGSTGAPHPRLDVLNAVILQPRGAIAGGIATKRLMLSLVVFRGMPLIEDVHPLQGGDLRRKICRSRRPGSPSDNTLLFYVRYWTNTFAKLAQLIVLFCRVTRIGRRAIASTRLAAIPTSQSYACRQRPRIILR